MAKAAHSMLNMNRETGKYQGPGATMKGIPSESMPLPDRKTPKVPINLTE